MRQIRIRTGGKGIRRLHCGSVVEENQGPRIRKQVPQGDGAGAGCERGLWV